MKLTQKTLGLSVIAMAAMLFASASLADNFAGRGMAEADADKDGKITKAEFEAWRTGKVTGGDADKDGKLSAQELAALTLKRAGAEAETRAKRMIAMHDADGDGLLSAEELVAMPMPGFDALDGNSDGVVDQAEVDAFRAEHGRMGRHGKGPRGHDDN